MLPLKSVIRSQAGRRDFPVPQTVHINSDDHPVSYPVATAGKTP